MAQRSMIGGDEAADASYAGPRRVALDELQHWWPSLLPSCLCRGGVRAVEVFPSLNLADIREATFASSRDNKATA